MFSKDINKLAEGVKMSLDTMAVEELTLYIENDGQLYRQYTFPMQTNLIKKLMHGKYDSNKAVKLFSKLIDAAVKKYEKEFDTKDLFGNAEKQKVAEYFKNDFETQIKTGDLEKYVAENAPKEIVKNKDALNELQKEIKKMPKKDIVKEIVEKYKTKKSSIESVVEAYKSKKLAGIGYELYAKGVDRISVQCGTISDSAKKLAKLVRENADVKKKNKALKDLRKWVDVLNGEMKEIISDINNLEGYKQAVTDELKDEAKGKLDKVMATMFLKSTGKYLEKSEMDAIRKEFKDAGGTEDKIDYDLLRKSIDKVIKAPGEKK